MTTDTVRAAHALLILVGCLPAVYCQTSNTTASTAGVPSLSPAVRPLPAEPASPSWLTGGGDVRVRNEYLNGALTLSDVAPLHEQDLFRVRGRLWSAATITPDLTLNLRLAAEPRIWEDSAFAKQHPGAGTEERYGILDNCNLKWAHAFDLPLTITAGRQDVQFGDPLNWWLVGDGTPSDGSWSFFLDSIRATLDAPGIKTKFDVVCIDQHARPDTWLPVLGAEGAYSLTEQNERGVILYASNKSLPDTQADAYFIYKKDDAVFAYSDNGNIYTLGGKLSGAPAPHWSYSAEGAWQWGWKQDSSVRTPVNLGAARRDIQSYGWNAKLSYLCKDAMDNQVSLVGEFLSGDDPGTTGKDEMFDVLWGRWPRFSELYIYSYPMETAGKVAQLNNLLRLGTSWSFVPAKGTTVSLTYNAWFAPESVPTRAMNSALFSRSGHFRGNFGQLWVKHQFSNHVSGQVWAEVLREGNYYARRDLLSYVRAEMLVGF
jgi:hypothetical protein